MLDKIIGFNYNTNIKYWRVGRVWLNATVLKTVLGGNPAKVRILHAPPNLKTVE